jgi:glycosyltransferase involved in cell wall biosynthesis
MSHIQFTVIIPVYNAEPFLEKAVLSALTQPQTGEVILVEDKSPDNCYAICQRLEAAHEKVKLLIHPNHENRGAGASRNFGMQKASFPFIAFLDADDYYLPGRFTKTEEIFINNPDIDGVYEACGFEFYSENAILLEAKDAGLNTENISNHIYTINEKIDPEDFFYRWVKGNIGFFQTNGLSFKKSLLDKTGYMDTELRLHQDTEFYYRLAAMGKLAPGEVTKPVSIIGRHENNRITNRTAKDIKYQVMVWDKLFRFVWQHKHTIDSRAIRYVIKNRIIFYNRSYTYSNRFLRLGCRILNSLLFVAGNPATAKYIFTHSEK